GAYAERNVAEFVALAGELDGRGGVVEPKGFASVKLEEVDSLADIGVCFGPVFTDFEGEPGAELEAAFANERGGGEQQGCTVLDGNSAPADKCGLRGLHRLLDVLLSCSLMDADHLSRMRGVHGEDFARGLQPAATDDDVVLAAEFGANIGERSLHAALVFGLGEIYERLVGEGRQRRGGGDGVG